MSSWLPSFNQASEAFAKIGGELNELTSELTSKVGGELNELSTKVGDINFNELSSKVQGALPINIDNELINKLTLRSDELVREHELLDAQEKRKELVREYLSEILPWETKDESRSVLVEKCREEILKLSLEKGTFETPFLLERGIMFNPSETFDDDYEEEEEEYDDEEEEVHFEHDNRIGNEIENENEDNKEANEANEAKDANETTDTLDTIEIKDVQPQAQAQAQGSSDELQPQQEAEAKAETETETKNGNKNKNKNKLEKDDGATNAAIIAASAAKLQKMQPLPLLLEHFDIDTHVGLIERLLKVDENLVHMHSMLSGAGEKESTFWRNYFFHCAYTRYENGLSIDEIWSSKPKAMITGVGVGVGAGGGVGGGVGGTSEGNFTSSVGQRRSDPSLEDIVDDQYDEYNEYDEYDESSSVELEMEIKNATSDIMDDNTHHSHAHSVSISTVNSEYSVGGGDDVGTTTGTGSTANHTTFSTTKTTTTMTTTTTTGGGATSAANANANSESSGSGTSYEMIGGEAVDVGLADVDDDGDMEDLDDLEAEIARELGEL